MLFLVAASILLGPNQAPSQSPSALSQYLSAHPWNPDKKGPMIAAEPLENSFERSEPDPLQFDELKVGSVSTIAPTEMVVVDPDFNAQPDLLDGMPRDDKVMYLASLLDSSQWNLATTIGIGLSDLHGEQVGIYRSILPPEFIYSNQVLLKGGQTQYLADQPHQIALSSQDEANVRLRFLKEVLLGIRFTNGGSSALAPQVGDEHKPGDYVPSRVPSSSEIKGGERDSLFGVPMRKLTPNHSKPSDLSYGSQSLDGQIALESLKTVDDVCEAASSASGLRLVADVRIGNWPVQTSGHSARVGDVLKALALSVTGTFRKVGQFYDFTSDLEGMGTRRLKIAFWRSQILVRIRLLAEQSKRQIADSGGILKSRLRADSLLGENDAMSSFIATDREEGDQTMSADLLTPAWRQFLDHNDRRFGPNNITRKDVVEPIENVDWQFVLPNGQSLQTEGWLGALISFRKNGSETDPRSSAKIQPIGIAADRAAALVYKTDDSAESVRLVNLAKSHGFRELWLQTWSQECLNAALKWANTQGISLRLVMKPWEASPTTATNQFDRTILGMTRRQSAELQFQSVHWKEAETGFGIAPFPTPNVIAPDSQPRDASWNALLALSRTKGLAGSVIVDTEPSGYEPLKSKSREWSLDETKILELGFTHAFREKFFSENRIDPIDFVDPRLATRNYNTMTMGAGAQTPFNLGPLNADQPADVLDRWSKMLSESNAEAVSDFARRVGAPTYFQVRNNVQNVLRFGGFRCVQWDSGDALPTGVEDPLEPEPLSKGDYWVLQFGYPLDPPTASRRFDNLTDHLKDKGGKIAIDLTAVPADQLVKMLDDWFKGP